MDLRFSEIYRFSSNVPFLELDCPLSGEAKLHRGLYEKQYTKDLPWTVSEELL
jgi:hypothetical protein